MDFLSPVVTKILKFFDFSTFNSVDLFFMKMIEKIAFSAWNSNLIKKIYDICNHLGNIKKRFVFFNSASL